MLSIIKTIKSENAQYLQAAFTISKQGGLKMLECENKRVPSVSYLAQVY